VALAEKKEESPDALIFDQSKSKEMLFQVGGQGTRPTFFEMAAAQQLPASLRAALTYSLGVKPHFLHLFVKFSPQFLSLCSLVLIFYFSPINLRACYRGEGKKRKKKVGLSSLKEICGKMRSLMIELDIPIAAFKDKLIKYLEIMMLMQQNLK